MYTNIHPLHLPPCKGMLFILMLFAKTLFGQNNALHFDGANDYITLSPIANLSAASDFTVEMWFFSTATGGNSTCNGDFRRLFGMAATGPNRLEVGECNGILSLFTIPSGVLQSSINIRDNQWHCISVVRAGSNLTVYLDGNPIPSLSFGGMSGFTATIFRVGRWAGGLGPDGEDWLGYVDEVKLWNIALPSTQLTTCSPCPLPGLTAGLIAYWRLDEGVPGGDNTDYNTVFDLTLSGNFGALSSRTALTPPGFDLGFSTGTSSNFVVSTAPLIYPFYDYVSVRLSDPLQTGGLSAICSGDPVHFSIVNSFLGFPTQANARTTVIWEYSDDCLNWTPVPIIPDSPSSAVFSGFTFVSPPGQLATSVANCSSNPNGFVDRCYRAIINVKNAHGTCAYTAQSSSLKIYCPISATMTLNPTGPLCDGDTVKFTASLTTNLPAPSSSNYVHINWCVIINGVTTPLTGPLYDDQMNINYLPIVNLNQICFKAVVSNFACTSVTLQQCVTVDSMPVCGTITGSASPNTLYPDPDGNPDHYVICPFDDAAVEIKTPFTSCIPLWQYMFPSGGTWNNLGSSNGVQNTNVLPHLKPSASPYLWPVGETCIIYRIKCLPLNNPSGCQPCYSNELRICLKSVPTIPIIVANPNSICKGSFSTLSVQNPSNNIDYNWYCNGLFVGNGSSLNASKKACYWVTATDIPACQTSTSDKICLEVCEAVAIISCPTPICPCLGYPITLNAMNSYSNCGPLKYFWSWSDSDGAQTSSDPNITSTPKDSGSIYTLIVTDANGCTDTTSMTVVPCAN